MHQCGFFYRLGQTSTKPRFPANTLHSLHWQLFMVQDLILTLKCDNVEACFILSGICFHCLGPKQDVMFVPKCADGCFQFLLAKCIPLIKLQYSFSWKLKISYIIIGERPFLTLKIPVAKYCKFFIWTEAGLPFFNNSSKLDFLS